MATYAKVNDKLEITNIVVETKTLTELNSTLQILQNNLTNITTSYNGAKDNLETQITKVQALINQSINLGIIE